MSENCGFLNVRILRRSASGHFFAFLHSLKCHVGSGLQVAALQHGCWDKGPEACESPSLRHCCDFPEFQVWEALRPSGLLPEGPGAPAADSLTARHNDAAKDMAAAGPLTAPAFSCDLEVIREQMLDFCLRNVSRGAALITARFISALYLARGGGGGGELKIGGSLFISKG